MAWVLLMAAFAASHGAAAQTSYRSDCRVTETTELDHFGREGQRAQLSNFTCRITGGPLHGFVVNGTNFWELASGDATTLLGSMAVAQKGSSSLVYEVHDVKRVENPGPGGARSWQATSWGLYRAASGSVATLAGKTFTSVARLTGPDTFTIDNTIND